MTKLTRFVQQKYIVIQWINLRVWLYCYIKLIHQNNERLLYNLYEEVRKMT
jgi:hypothetical protein